ncbi:MAG: preprotein translocase subunit SecG [Deltaproteobacteria bacterium]|nr:preprotein translocase subunit SecG [Deltaproteobacteria bacterium]
MFGGGGANTVFGSSGAGGFLTKLTTAGAVVFMLTCMVLAYLSGTTDSAVLRELEETTTAPAPIDEAPVDEAPLAEDAAPAAGADEAAPAANEADAAAPGGRRRNGTGRRTGRGSRGGAGSHGRYDGINGHTHAEGLVELVDAPA